MNQHKRVLAIDTSTRIQALALVEGSEQLARRHHVTRGNHADTLLHNIHDMLTQHGWTVDALDLVACGLGPGSFTGLRVGLANAKALAFSAGADLAGVSSLAAIARPVTNVVEGPVLAAIDARRNEVFAGLYQADGERLVVLREECALGPDALAKWIESLGHVSVVGGGYQTYFGQAPCGAARILGSGWDSPSPYSIATLGRLAAVSPSSSAFAALEPNYIRPSDAEANLAARA